MLPVEWISLDSTMENATHSRATCVYMFIKMCTDDDRVMMAVLSYVVIWYLAMRDWDTWYVNITYYYIMT